MTEKQSLKRIVDMNEEELAVVLGTEMDDVRISQELVRNYFYETFRKYCKENYAGRTYSQVGKDFGMSGRKIKEILQPSASLRKSNR